MSQPGAGGGGGDNLVPAVLLSIGVLVGAWWGLRTYVITGSVWMLRAEAAIIAPAVETLGSEKQRKEFAAWQKQLTTVPKIMPAATLGRGLNAGGKWIRWPIALVVLVIAVWVYLRSPTTKYARTMDFEGLVREQQRSFPRIRPVVWLRNKLHDKDRGAYTWALSPYEYAAKIGAISPSVDTARTQASFDPGRAHAAFSQQLGGAFNGAAALPYHMQILFAAFAARCMDQRAESEAILDAAGAGFQPVGWSRGWRATWRRWTGRQWDWPAKGPFEIALTPSMDKQINAVILAAEKHARVMAIIARHHHAYAVLVGLLRVARERQGTVASSDFIWVKAIDRVLHYALNDLGRRVASAEAGGVRAHILHEAAHGRTETPRVDGAVEALRKHLQECGWEAPPSHEYDEAEMQAATSEASAIRLRMDTGAEAPSTPHAAATGGGGGGHGMSTSHHADDQRPS